MMCLATLSVDPTLMYWSYLFWIVSQIVAIVHFVKAIKCIKLYRKVRRNIQDKRYWIADAKVVCSVPEAERTLISFEYDGKQYEREFDFTLTLWRDSTKQELLTGLNLTDAVKKRNAGQTSGLIENHNLVTDALGQYHFELKDGEVLL